jgi:hypothetical protein
MHQPVQDGGGDHGVAEGCEAEEVTEHDLTEVS